MFINTLPIIFTYTHLFTPLEALIFLGAVFCLSYFYAPEINHSWKDIPVKNWYLLLHSAWLGHVALWRAFWPFFLLVNIILYYIDHRISNVTYTIASWKTVHGMLLLPILWWVTSVWRCSANTAHKLWGASARALTLYLLLELILRFFISTQYPNTFFDCRLLVMEYGDCL
ncbi:MAG: hypothetical protein Q7U57_10820 [Methylovulum sp.]|nr:hypothetical protein [Methylovulum sp.]